MSYSYKTLGIEVDAGVAVATIDNPPLNLMDEALLRDLDGFARRVRDDRTIKVIVFQSADPEFFSAHGDMTIVDRLQEAMATPLALDQSHDLNPMARVFERLHQLPQVTIGKVAGYARGGGAEFLAALDMRFASLERGKLGQMEALVGMITGAGASARLAPLIGRARTLEIILGAALFDAATAERYGWINRALPDAELRGGRIDWFLTAASQNSAAQDGHPMLT